MFRKQSPFGRLAGITLVLFVVSNVMKSNVVVIAKPGSINPHTKFKGEAYILTKEEGGRHTHSFNYCPQFYFRTTGRLGSILNFQQNW